MTTEQATDHLSREELITQLEITKQIIKEEREIIEKLKEIIEIFKLPLLN